MRAPRLSDGSRSSLRLLMPGTAANVAAGRRCDAGSWRTGPAALPPQPAGTPRMGRGARSGRRSRPILRRASSATTVRSLSTKPACAGSWRCCRRARELEAHGVVPEGPVGQARPAERVLAFFDPLFRGTTAVLELDHAPGRPAQVGDDEADAGIQLTLLPLESGHRAT